MPREGAKAVTSVGVPDGGCVIFSASDEQIAFLIVRNTCEWPLVPFQEDWPARSRDQNAVHSSRYCIADSTAGRFPHMGFAAHRMAAQYQMGSMAWSRVSRSCARHKRNEITTLQRMMDWPL